VTLADRPTGAGQPKRHLVAEWLRASPLQNGGRSQYSIESATAFQRDPAAQQIRSGIKSATDGKSGRSGWVLVSCGRRSASLSRGQHDHLAVVGPCANFEHLHETKDLTAFLLLV
jgi:phage gpG-like protein